MANPAGQRDRPFSAASTGGRVRRKMPLYYEKKTRDPMAVKERDGSAGNIICVGPVS